MVNFDAIRNRLDCPKIGKILVLTMLSMEMSVYVYLTITNKNSQQALTLSCFLLLASFFTFLSTVLSISLTFYYYHSNLYFISAGLSILTRIIIISFLVVLNYSTSDELFLTQDGYATMMRTNLIFLILQAVLVLEKHKFYRTKKEVQEMQEAKLSTIWPY